MRDGGTEKHTGSEMKEGVDRKRGCENTETKMGARESERYQKHMKDK